VSSGGCCGEPVGGYTGQLGIGYLLWLDVVGYEVS